MKMSRLDTMTREERLIFSVLNRGLLKRIADKHKIDPSMVSRVLHGLRRHSLIHADLEQAVQKWERRGPLAGGGSGTTHDAR